jgi:hypothetical protein
MGFQTGMIRVREEPAPSGHFDQRNAFLNGAPGDREEVFSVGLGEATVSLGEVRRDRQCGSVELVDKKVIPARKVFGVRGCRVGEIHGLLVDLKILEDESHWFIFESFADRPGAGEQLIRTPQWNDPTWAFFLSPARLFYFSTALFAVANRGDRIRTCDL